MEQRIPWVKGNTLNLAVPPDGMAKFISIYADGDDEYYWLILI